MKNHASIEIDAPPERVFTWIDDADRVAQWLPNVVENENLEVTPQRVGSTFRQVYVENGRRMEMQGVVTAYEPNRQLTVAINYKDFDLDVDYRLDDLGGRTRLTQDSEVRFKGPFKFLALVMMPFVKRSSNQQLLDTLVKLKALVESDAARTNVT